MPPWHNNFTIFVALLCFSSASLGNEDPTTPHNVPAGESITLSSGSSEPTATRCIVQTNTGFEFSLRPGDGNVPSGISEAAFRTCDTLISAVNDSHIGTWTIKTYFESNEDENEEEVPIVSRHIIRVHEKTYVTPLSIVKPYPGTVVAVRLQDYYENLDECIVDSPTGESYKLLGGSFTDEDDVRPLYQCGVMIRANASHNGEWIITAAVGDKFYAASFIVAVQVVTQSTTQADTITVREGSAAVVKFGPTTAKFCELERPGGKIVSIQEGKCYGVLSPATRAHEGIWIARYALPGRTTVIEESFRVDTYVNRDLNVTVETVPRRPEINLLCRVHASTMSFCTFVRPDGKRLHFSVGMGNDDYVYYGNGSQSWSTSQRTQDCGVTILKPSSVDYGAWQCLVGTGSESQIGSIVRVSSTKSNRNSMNIESRDVAPVWVRKGDSFEISCGVNAVLSYCWVRSPNGTSYASSGYSTSDLVYSGAGLALGECGVIVPHAVDSDVGQWQCHMGISEGEERTSNVPVYVSETTLMATNSEVRILPRRNGPSTVLSCQVLPGYDQTIDYCRWVRPDGSGIHQHSRNSRFTTSRSLQTCEITIRDHDTSDIGEWNCMAGFTASGETGRAGIRVRTVQNHAEASIPGTTAVCISITLGILALIFSGFTFYMISSKIRSKITPMDAPPPYNARSYDSSTAARATSP